MVTVSDKWKIERKRWNFEEKNKKEILECSLVLCKYTWDQNTIFFCWVHSIHRANGTVFYYIDQWEYKDSLIKLSVTPYIDVRSIYL